MINSLVTHLVNSQSDNKPNLTTSLAQPIKAHTATTELSGLKNTAPAITEELLSQFDDTTVEQLLHQQLASLTTSSSAPTIANYQYSDQELALRTVISSQQEGLLNSENSDKLMQRLNSSVKDIHGAYANTSDILASLGQLGHKQESFLASSEQRVDRALGLYLSSMNRSNNEEGDIINISVNSSQGYDEKTGKTVDGFVLATKLMVTCLQLSIRH
ncbi:hypothetical protein [Colwellia ponticola]|uniref:hypothetical protein n=1 Tax=Colwellia ponticola TaxID=2304625 RepID=UPI001FEC20DF|nr:hypothetical protein [Colwellia ponticola]